MNAAEFLERFNDWIDSITDEELLDRLKNMKDKPPTTATNANFDKMKCAEKRRILSTAGIFSQAEAIADHYAKLASDAMKLRRMVHLIRYSQLSPSEHEETLAYIVRNFKRHHADDFGIELEWKGEQDER